MKRWYVSLVFVFVASMQAWGQEVVTEVELPVVSAGQIQRVQGQLVALEAQMRELFIVRNTLIQAAAERNSVNLSEYNYAINDGKFVLKPEEPDEDVEEISP